MDADTGDGGSTSVRTRRRDLVDELRRRIALERTVAAISSRFIALAGDRIDAGIDEALASLGACAGADRSYIFLFRSDGRIYDNTHEWCAPGIAPQRERCQGLDLAAVPWFAGRIRSQEPIVVHTAALPPEAAAERAMLEAQEVRSLAIVPMLDRGALIGFLGFDAVRGERAWDDDALPLLRIVGEIMVAALARKRAEEAAEHAMRRWQAIADAPDAYIFEVDRDRRLRWINRLAPGFAPGQVLGRRMEDFMPPEQHATALEAFARVLAGAGPQCYRVLGHGPGGALRWYESRLVPLHRDDAVDGAVCFSTDITERRDAEERLRASEERFRLLFAGSPLGISASRDGLLLFVNRAYGEMFGYADLAALAGRPVTELIAPEHRLAVAERIRRCERGEAGTSCESVGLRRDGVRFPIHVDIGVIELADGSATVAFVSDLSERRRLEERARLMVAVLENTSDMVGTADREGRVLYLNRAGRRMCGIVEDEDVTRLRIAAFHTPDALAQVHEGVAAAMRAGTWSGETRLLRRDGVEIPVSQVIIVHRDAQGEIECISTVVRDISERKRDEQALRASEARLHSAFENLPFWVWACDGAGRVVLQNRLSVRDWGDLRGGQLASSPLPGTLRDRLAQSLRRVAAGEVVTGEDAAEIGGSRRHVYYLVAPMPASDGGTGHIGLVMDVTDRKALEEQLRQAQQLDAVGKLAGGVAHDFNNLLTAILGFDELLLARHPPGDPSHRHLDQIRRAAERGAALTRQLLAFGRKQVLQPRAIRLTAVIGDLLELLRPLLGGAIDVAIEAEPGLWEVVADPHQIEQVLLNLAVNARDAMPDGGRLSLRLSNRRGGGDRLPPGDWVELEVADTGCGMSREVLDQAFVPFFTTKPPGKGTGLGLSTVYGIVTQSGGRIAVASEPGMGAIFTIHLPRAASAAPTPQPDTGRRRRNDRGDELVVLVEDDATVREVVRTALTSAGYEVIEAADGIAGLEAVRLHRERARLLVTDVVMPGIGGRDLTQRALALAPDLRVLLVSGYSAESPGDLGQQVAFLDKPFTRAALLKRVREVLDG